MQIQGKLENTLMKPSQHGSNEGRLATQETSEAGQEPVASVQ